MGNPEKEAKRTQKAIDEITLTGEHIYQIYESRYFGADAILLIARILEKRFLLKERGINSFFVGESLLILIRILLEVYKGIN